MRSRAARKGMQLSARRGHKAALAAALVVEVAIFAIFAPNFFTLANFFEIARLNAELGLLAVALTPILITGGIDLSVGAVMGLAAVCFGAAWRDLHLPDPGRCGRRARGRLRRRRTQRRAHFAVPASRARS